MGDAILNGVPDWVHQFCQLPWRLPTPLGMPSLCRSHALGPHLAQRRDHGQRYGRLLEPRRPAPGVRALRPGGSPRHVAAPLHFCGVDHPPSLCAEWKSLFPHLSSLPACPPRCSFFSSPAPLPSFLPLLFLLPSSPGAPVRPPVVLDFCARQLTFRYPTPGDTLATVSVGVWSHDGGAGIRHVALDPSCPYFAQLIWTSRDTFVFTELTRSATRVPRRGRFPHVMRYSAA